MKMNDHPFLILEGCDRATAGEGGSDTCRNVVAREVCNIFQVENLSCTLDIRDSNIHYAQSLNRERVFLIVERQNTMAPGVTDTRRNASAREGQRPVRSILRRRHGRSA